MSSALSTRKISQLGEAADLDLADLFVVQRGGGPAQAIKVEALVDFLEEHSPAGNILELTERAEAAATEAQVSAQKPWGGGYDRVNLDGGGRIGALVEKVFAQSNVGYGNGFAEVRIDRFGRVGTLVPAPTYPAWPGVTLPFPPLPGQLCMVLSYGQSNGEGTGGLPVPSGSIAIGRRFNAGIRTQDGQGNTDAVNHASLVALDEQEDETTYLGNTGLRDWVTSYDAEITAQTGLGLAARGQLILAAAPGEGGASAHVLAPYSGYAIFSRLVTDITYGYIRSQALGLSFGGVQLVIHQGEAEMDDLTFTAAWSANWTQILDTIEATIVGLTQRPENVTATFGQVSAQGYDGVGGTYDLAPTIPLAQLNLARTDPRVGLYGPQYIADFQTGDVHLTSISHSWLMDYSGRYNAEWAVTGRKPKWLQPKRAWRQGRQVIVEFDVPVEPLVLDTSWVTDPNGQMGFELINRLTGAQITISSVTTWGGRFITLVAASDLPQALDVAGAHTPPGGVAVTRPGRTTGARMCLRDSKTGAFTGNIGGAFTRNRHNYCVTFRERVS